MPKDLHELAEMIAKRDHVSEHEAEQMIALCQLDMEAAFYNGNLDLAEQIMSSELNLDSRYFNLFID